MPKYFKAWIIFFLIATVGGFILGVILGAFLGALMKIVGHAELSTIKFTARVVGMVIAIPISYFTFRWVVSEFVVKELVKVSPSVPPAIEPPPIAKCSTH